MEIIITAATIMAMYLNTTANSRSSFAYNADIENNQVKTMYVMNDNHGTLSNRLQYHYEYDELGRLKSRITLRANAFSNQNMPTERLDYQYDTEGYTLTRSTWNRQKQCFNRPESRICYRQATPQVMSVLSYQLDKKSNSMLMTDQMLAMNCRSDNWVNNG